MIGFVFRRAQAKGLLGGSRPWLVIWIVLLAVRLLRRVTRDTPDVLYCEELGPGQTVVISARDREPKVIGA